MTERPRRTRTLQDTEYFKQGSYKRQFVDYIYQIGITTILAKTILAPIQRYRIISQTQLVYPYRPVPFKNVFDYIKRVPSEQGFMAFWRGNMSTIGIFFAQTFFQIGIYDNIKSFAKEWVQQSNPQETQIPIYLSRILLPLVSSFLTQIITFPMDTARVRISMNYATNLKKSPFYNVRSCLRHIRAEQDGFRSMYKGFLLSNAISFINFNLYLSVAQALTTQTTQQNDKSQSILKNYQQYINNDTISAVAALAIVHPLDTLKKIIQLNNISNPSIISNIQTALTFISQEHNYRILYRGMTASIFKSLLFVPAYILSQKLVSETKNQVQSFI